MFPSPYFPLAYFARPYWPRIATGPATKFDVLMNAAPKSTEWNPIGKDIVFVAQGKSTLWNPEGKG
jgi:hypothetical protein